MATGTDRGYVYGFALGLMGLGALLFWKFGLPLGVVVGGPVIALGFIVLGAALPKTKYFCSACDQYLGEKWHVCERCGSNRYYTQTES